MFENLPQSPCSFTHYIFDAYSMHINTRALVRLAMFMHAKTWKIAMVYSCGMGELPGVGKKKNGLTLCSDKTFYWIRIGVMCMHTML